MSAHSSGKGASVYVSPEYEAWSAALLAGFTISEWLDPTFDPSLRALVIAYYRTHDMFNRAIEILSTPAVK